MTGSSGAAKFAGRIALVTGGSRGIGRGIALTLAAQGAAVVVNSRRQAEAATRVCAEIEKLAGWAVRIGADVSDHAAVSQMREASAAQFGRLDILVADSGVSLAGCAGGGGRLRTLAQGARGGLNGAFYTVRAMLPLLFGAPATSAIFISIGTDLCDPCGAPYCAA